MNGIKFVSAVIVAAALCVISTAKVNAMTVNWTNTSNPIALADATTGVPYGDAVYLGIFQNNMSNAAIQALFTGNSQAATAIMAQFNVYLSDVMGDDGAGGSLAPVVGAFGAANNGGPGAGFFNSNAFFIAINASTIAGATQIYVGKGPSALWSFGPDDLANLAFNTDAFGAAETVVGSFIVGGYGDAEANGATGWFGDGQNELVLAQIVPEPSTYMLVAMGLLGAWGMRRRRS
jgi:hypothetical protein